MSGYTEVTDSNFEEHLKKATLVVAYFSASWCGPCKAFGPVFEEVATELAGSSLLFLKIDTDNAPNAAEKHRISSIPTILFFSEGKQVRSVSGVQKKEDLIQAIKQLQG
ncbi:thioredoxin [Candidatus Similichlamydia laticola]|uniref:Thioredoxin n=1 Tax=Candidatus Similichlamydia laticola TaxID=2170265 RepID=A0A369KK35_9BACT|nr:thioredoxin [Candidatus Similichlamydia laticola]RDB31356.1 Thioredoxin [Candidatus Similichlamydia laticola]